MSAVDVNRWREICAYLDHALDCTPEQRATWLDELRGRAPALALEIEALLAEHEALDDAGFLAGCALNFVPAAALKGRTFGSYTLESLIGRGGMGTVWLARRSDGRFEGKAAIKLLHMPLVGGAGEERFRREVRLLAKVTHPNIARLLDAGATAAGQAYIVLEHIAGRRVDRYCDEQGLGVEGRIKIFLDVLAAVAHAHANVVVHRDVKPSNVLVTEDGVVKLLDFGIAKLLSTDSDADEQTFTRLEDVALTPEYAAPEQIRGDVPSTATDIYQLGMLLYVLLTGTHPLSGVGSRAERIKAALEGVVPRASEWASGPVQRKLRGDLDAILALALRKDPTERYATAAALRDDLVRYLGGHAVLARRGVALYHARKFVARHRIMVTVSAVALVSLCAALIFALNQASIAAAERSRAVALVARSEAVTQFLGTLITEAAESEQPVTVSEMLDRSEQLAMLDVRGNPENRAAVLTMIAARYSAMSDSARAARLLEHALQLLRGSSDHALQARLRCEYALSLSGLGRQQEAVKMIEQELRRSIADSETLAYCMLDRASIAGEEADAEAALRYAMQGLEQFRRAPRTAAADEGLFLSAVAYGHHLSGRNREADAYFRQALQNYAGLGREYSPDAATVRNDWAIVMSTAGVPKRSLQLYDETLQVIERRNPNRPPPVYLIGNRARTLERIGRLREAQKDYELELRISTTQPNLRTRGHALLGLASIAQQLGDRTSAEKFLQEVFPVLRPSVAPDAPPWVTAATIQGRLALDSGQLATARANFVRAIGAKTGAATPLEALLGKAEAELMAGDMQGAASDARRALSIAVSLQGDLPYSRTTGLARLMLGRTLQALGDQAQAHKAFETALTQLLNTVDADHPAVMQARESLQLQLQDANTQVIDR